MEMGEQEMENYILQNERIVLSEHDFLYFTVCKITENLINISLHVTLECRSTIIYK